MLFSLPTEQARELSSLFPRRCKFGPFQVFLLFTVHPQYSMQLPTILRIHNGVHLQDKPITPLPPLHFH
jgi:hypothetical protein